MNIDIWISLLGVLTTLLGCYTAGSFTSFWYDWVRFDALCDIYAVELIEWQ